MRKNYSFRNLIDCSCSKLNMHVISSTKIKLFPISYNHFSEILDSMQAYFFSHKINKNHKHNGARKSAQLARIQEHLG
jgi:hypothetical protein